MQAQTVGDENNAVSPSVNVTASLPAVPAAPAAAALSAGGQLDPSRGVLSIAGSADTSVSQDDVKPLAPGPPLAYSSDRQPLPGPGPGSASEDPDRVAVPPPHRRKKSHSHVRGILKPAHVPPPRFSFRRDVLGYVNESLSPIAQVVSGVAAGSATQPSSDDLQISTTFSSASSAPIATRSAPNVTQTHNNPAEHQTPQQHQPSGRAFGGVWRRLGGAVSAVAANVPVPQAAARTMQSLKTSANLPTRADSAAQPTEAGLVTSPNSHDASAIQAQALPSSHPLEVVKSVRFTMSSLSIVYPLSSGQAPGGEASTRKRVNREYKRTKAERSEKGWTGDELARLYDECCRTREEPRIPSLRRLLSDCPTPPKVIDLKNQLLTKGAVEVLSDLLSVEFGLRKLVLENCGLDDDSLKPLIHSLLVTGTLPTLSLANNKRIRNKGWKLVSLFVSRSPHLKYLDLSDNTIDKRIADGLVAALQGSQQPRSPNDTSIEGASSRMLLREQASSAQFQDEAGSHSDEDDLPPTWAAPLLSRRSPTSQANTVIAHSPSSSTLTSLRLESCSLKNPTLESLAHGIRQSDVKHVSLRRNRINNMGAVALAVMIRDYELPGYNGNSASASPTAERSYPGLRSPNGESLLFPSSNDHRASAGPSLSTSLNGHHSAQATRTGGNSVTARLDGAASAHRLPPPRSSTQPSGTHTPTYTPRIAQRTSSPAPGVEGNRPPSLLANADAQDDIYQEAPFGPERNNGRVVLTSEREAIRHHELKTRLKLQIEALPRVGSLLTLDVRSNDIRGGITYIAQVLKRNRTLKVLNLSDNKIDTQGLSHLAEALKYNSTLETLDLSNNPCSGPNLEGITTLRTAFAYNTSLMRIFLNNTDLSSAGAIALAEFLPDISTLIHLDLTDNPEIDIAGIMALAAAVKLNTTMRCLDLSIPPNDPEFARLSQDILQSCVRNTELAQEQSAAKGAKVAIAAPIYKSGLARDLKELERVSDPDTLLQALPSSWSETVATAKQCIRVLNEASQAAAINAFSLEDLQQRTELVNTAVGQAYAAQGQLNEALLNTGSAAEQDALKSLIDQLTAVLHRRATIQPAAQQSLSVNTRSPDRPDALLSPLTPIRSPGSPTRQVPSPSFSITSSDDSDASSVDESRGVASSSQAIAKSPNPRPPSLEIPVDAAASLNGSPKSPVENQSRTLTLEEGEVFRRGTSKIGENGTKTLLDMLDEDEEGEELKQEILEVEVKRTRRTSLSTEDSELQQQAMEQAAQSLHEDVSPRDP